MTRHVFSNRMLAHVWAQQEQDYGRSGNGNLHFRGATLYSYREPIARFTQSADGRPIVLVTSEKFSVTTSAHCNHAAGAVRGQTVYYVPDTGHDSVEPDHHANLAYLVNLARDYAGKVRTSRFDSWESRPVVLSAEFGADWSYADRDTDHGADDAVPLFIGYAAQAFRRAAVYAATFGLAAELDGPAEIAAAVDAWGARWKRYSSPEAARKRERAAVYRERARERKAAAEHERKHAAALHWFAEWKAGARYRPQSYHFKPGTAEYAELLAMEQVEREQAERHNAEAFALWQAGQAPRPAAWRFEHGTPERAAIEADEHREQFEREAATRAAWLAGEAVYYHGRDTDGGALLRARRVERDAAGAIVGGMLQTSLGVDVPLVEALRAFRFMRLIWARGATWERNGGRVPVGHFQLDKIYPNGDVKAGCHLLRRPEIERIAAELGVADVEASGTAVAGRTAVAAE